jgi:hypothetical protein
VIVVDGLDGLVNEGDIYLFCPDLFDPGQVGADLGELLDEADVGGEFGSVVRLLFVVAILLLEGFPQRRRTQGIEIIEVCFFSRRFLPTVLLQTHLRINIYQSD